MLLPFLKKKSFRSRLCFPLQQSSCVPLTFRSIQEIFFFFSRFEIPGRRKEDPLLFSIRLLHSSPFSSDKIPWSVGSVASPGFPRSE